MATGRQMSRRMDRRSIIYIENELLEYTYIYITHAYIKICIHIYIAAHMYVHISYLYNDICIFMQMQ